MMGAACMYMQLCQRRAMCRQAVNLSRDKAQERSSTECTKGYDYARLK